MSRTGFERNSERKLVERLSQGTALCAGANNLHSEAGALILKMAYDYNIERDRADPLIAIIERMAANFSAAAVPSV